MERNYLGQICDTALAVAGLGLKWFLPFLEHEGPFSGKKKKIIATRCTSRSCQSRQYTMTKFGPNPVSVVNSIHISLVIVITKEGTSPGWRISTWYDAMQICGARLIPPTVHRSGRLRLKFDGTRAETRFRLSAKRMSPFKSAGASVQSTTGS